MDDQRVEQRSRVRSTGANGVVTILGFLILAGLLAYVWFTG